MKIGTKVNEGPSKYAILPGFSFAYDDFLPTGLVL